MVSIIPVSFFLYMGFLGGLYNGWLTYSTVLTRSVLNIILLLILSTPVFYFMRLTIKDLTHKEFFKKDVYKL